jgi:GT2 family glycosyltransferase
VSAQSATPAPAPDPSQVQVGVVVVSWNVRELLRRCLASLSASPVPQRVVVVDNASADGSVDMVRAEFPAVTLLAAARNLGFTQGNNAGLRALGVLPPDTPAADRDPDVAATPPDAAADPPSSRPPDPPLPPPCILLLNPDAELLPGALEALTGYLAGRPSVGAVGPLLLNPDGSVQSSRRRFPTLATALVEGTPIGWHWPGNRWARAFRLDDVPPDRAGPVGWVTGAAMLLRTPALAAVGGFDEGFFMYSEEVDLCRRLRSLGWEVHFEPAARVLHHEGQSSGQVPGQRHRAFQRSRVRYFRKHHGRLAGEVLRVGVLAQFGAEALVEAAKLALGHKPSLRRQRLAAYVALLRDGLG